MVKKALRIFAQNVVAQEGWARWIQYSWNCQSRSGNLQDKWPTRWFMSHLWFREAVENVKISSFFFFFVATNFSLYFIPCKSLLCEHHSINYWPKQKLAGCSLGYAINNFPIAAGQKRAGSGQQAKQYANWWKYIIVFFLQVTMFRRRIITWARVADDWGFHMHFVHRQFNNINLWPSIGALSRRSSRVRKQKETMYLSLDELYLDYVCQQIKLKKKTFVKLHELTVFTYLFH